MPLSDVTATVHDVGIDAPLIDRDFEITVVVVAAETDDGLVGHGLTGYHWPYAARDLVNREMAPRLEGRDPFPCDARWTELREALNPRMQTGAWSQAMSAVDIALWDLKGKRFGEPVWRLLGGNRRTVPTYVTFGLPEYDTDQLVEVAERCVARGADGLKMVVGPQDPDHGGETLEIDPVADAERVRAVREAVGPEVDLMIDGNYLFSVGEAIDLANRVEEYDVRWFEEPVYDNDIELLSTLRDRTSIPIAAGQNEGYRVPHRRLIEGGAVDVAQPNVCHVGGYTEARRVAATAQSFNVNVTNGGGWPHHNMHLHGGVPNGRRVEFHALMRRVGERLYRDPPEPEGGDLTLPDEPGLGLEPDPDALRETRVET